MIVMCAIPLLRGFAQQDGEGTQEAQKRTQKAQSNPWHPISCAFCVRPCASCASFPICCAKLLLREGGVAARSKGFRAATKASRRRPTRRLRDIFLEVASTPPFLRRGIATPYGVPDDYACPLQP